MRWPESHASNKRIIYKHLKTTVDIARFPVMQKMGLILQQEKTAKIFQNRHFWKLSLLKVWRIFVKILNVGKWRTFLRLEVTLNTAHIGLSWKLEIDYWIMKSSHPTFWNWIQEVEEWNSYKSTICWNFCERSSLSFSKSDLIWTSPSLTGSLNFIELSL